MSSQQLALVLEEIDRSLGNSVERLFDLLRIKTISTDPKFAAECRKGAEGLVNKLRGIGFDATLRDTPGHPMVLAHHEGVTLHAPHLLFYGDYDVQPVDPIEPWHDDPFAPSIKDDDNGATIIIGRGSSDDKGQLMTFVEACLAYKTVHGSLPCRVKIFFEGEEESGSASLKPFLEANKAELTADIALVCDTSMYDPETPSICVSLRGLVGEEVVVKAASRDLHSGYYGRAAANPIRVLAKAVADVHDQNGHVTIPGFYDGVEETPAQVLEVWEKPGKTPETFLGQIGLSIPSGEKGRSILELTWARPTAEFNGISGGYTGTGFKTVIPAEASTKVSFRLVHKQDPARILEAFRAFICKRVSADCSVEFHQHGGSPAIQLPYDSPELTRARQALADEWGKPMLLLGGGGSIPVVGDFQTYLGITSLMVGFALDDDRIHSPNEKYNCIHFTRASARGRAFWTPSPNRISHEHDTFS